MTARWLEGRVELPGELARALRAAPGEPSAAQLLELAGKLSAVVGAPLSAPPPGPALVKGVRAAAKPLSALTAWVAGGIVLGAGLSGFAYLAARPASPAPVKVAARKGAIGPNLRPQPSLPVAPGVDANGGKLVAPSVSSRHATIGAGSSAAKHAAAIAREEPSSPPESEVMLLKRAQQALASDPAQALGLTNQHQEHFKGGLLEQEREVIAIAALLQLGQTARASTRAAQFRERYPGSAHTRRLDALFTEKR
jgi:hypothetical protein